MTLNDLAAFKKKYKTAIKSGAVSFMFKEQEYLTSYAKYVIEYMSLNMAKL